MKYIIVLFLLNSMSSISQIWKEPFDTTFNQAELNRLDEDNFDIKSYTISQFDSSGAPVLFDYYEFNNQGYRIEVRRGISAEQELDTIRYYYSDAGVLQKTEYQGMTKKNTNPEFFKDSQNRTIAIINKDDKSVSTTNFYYSTLGKLDSIKYRTGRLVKFEYDNGQLSKKSIIDKGKLSEYLNYHYPKKKVTAYCDCHLIKIYNDTVTACDSTIGTFNKHGRLLKLEEYFYMDTSAHHTNFKYDKKGRILKMFYNEATGNASTIYFRNRRGLLTRIEHRDDQMKVYNYSDFKYEYR